MTRGGRPLRFLALVMGGWIGMRVMLLWPEGATLPQAIRAAVPGAVAADRGLPAAPVSPAAAVSLTGIAAAVGRPVVTAAPISMVPATIVAAALRDVPIPGERRALAPESLGVAEPASVVPLVQSPLVPRKLLRAMVSIWALARPGAATGGPVQLGGGQVGMRMQIPVPGIRRLALSGRLSSPLAGPGREVALGMEWRPLNAPLAVVIERRMALDRSGSGTGAGVIAGIDRPGVVAGFDLEAYGQAGAVARAGIEPYADGAVRALRPVANVAGTVLRLGIGGWGGAQRGAARLDIGPSAVVALPIGGKPVRLSIEWRQRIAGDAAPGSGPAVTLGSDF